MKEFDIKAGKRIHPYVKKNKITKIKNLKVLSVEDFFIPEGFATPFKLTLLKDTLDTRDFTSGTKPELFQNAPALKASTIVDYASEMSPIKNQGNLGSCVAFAAAAMKEWQEKKEHTSEVKEGKRDHRKGKEYDYSEAWIYWNCKKIDGYSGEGTSLRASMKVLNKIGVPTEKAWPYSDNKLNIGEPKRWASLVSKWAMIGTYYSIRTIEEAKIALAQDGPFVMGLPCFYDFFFPVNGVIANPNDGDTIYGGHAICCVGYDDERRLLKFKNSWGTGWGQEGYGYISYDYYEKYNWGSWACKDLSVTKEMIKEARSLI